MSESRKRETKVEMDLSDDIISEGQHSRRKNNADSFRVPEIFFSQKNLFL